VRHLVGNLEALREDMEGGDEVLLGTIDTWLVYQPDRPPSSERGEENVGGAHYRLDQHIPMVIPQFSHPQVGHHPCRIRLPIITTSHRIPDNIQRPAHHPALLQGVRHLPPQLQRPGAGRGADRGYPRGSIGSDVWTGGLLTG